MRKFNETVFMKAFLEKLEITYRDSRGYVSVSDLALQVCREHHFAMNANRAAMTQALQSWWNQLPRRKNMPWERRLFKRFCYASPPRCVPFIPLERASHGVRADFIVWLSIQ